jgi:hypothetical protein
MRGVALEECAAAAARGSGHEVSLADNAIRTSHSQRCDLTPAIQSLICSLSGLARVQLYNVSLPSRWTLPSNWPGVLTLTHCHSLQRLDASAAPGLIMLNIAHLDRCHLDVPHNLRMLTLYRVGFTDLDLRHVTTCRERPAAEPASTNDDLDMASVQRFKLGVFSCPHLQLVRYSNVDMEIENKVGLPFEL